MAPTKSRSQRKAAFLQAASEMYERLEAWYDAHPTATFEELEQELRPQRRELMGGALATLIVASHPGFDKDANIEGGRDVRPCPGPCTPKPDRPAHDGRVR